MAYIVKRGKPVAFTLASRAFSLEEKHWSVPGQPLTHQRYAVMDYPPRHRKMGRTAIIGDMPYRMIDMTSVTPTVLIVPGLREHVSDHWQTLLAAKLPRVCSVAPLEHDKLSCAARVDAIDRALATIEGAVIIVAHSAGAMMVAHWAAAQHATREIRGALLAAPADLETPMPAGYPTIDALQDHGWLPIPRRALPFPSIVAAGSNDPLTRLDRAREFAQAWGSRFVELGAVGHLNPASGHGEWPRAEEFIRELS